jgi:hypothetical protein
MAMKHGSGGLSADDEWTEAKNTRRCDLLDKEIDGTLNAAEAKELAELQQHMLRHRRRVAPVPLASARRLYQELLARVQPEGEEAGF